VACFESGRRAADLADAEREVEACAVGLEVAARVLGGAECEPEWVAEAPERVAEAPERAVCARDAGE
jgi:hypothetical protein